MTDLYTELELTRDATPDEIKTAFRRRAQATHPDKEGGSEEAFKAVKHAYEVLSDPAWRKSYDDTGSTAAVVSVEEEAEKMLANLFGQLLDFQEPGNPLVSLKVEVGTVLKRESGAAKDAVKSAEKYAKLLGKFNRKSQGKPNLFQSVLTTRKRQAELESEAHQRNMAVCKCILALLDDYEFTGDPLEGKYKGKDVGLDALLAHINKTGARSAY